MPWKIILESCLGFIMALLHHREPNWAFHASMDDHLWTRRALTVLPASLLCLFMAERASGRFSRASANSRDTSTPKSASSLHPPHFQPSPGGPLWWESQPQMVDVPSAQERVTAKATPADAMAWTKADSRVAGNKESPCGYQSR